MSILGRFLLSQRPILTAFGPSPLQATSSHDDNSTLLLPNHPPKVTVSLGQRALRRDESILLFVAINVVSINVVGAGVVGIFDRQDDSTMVVAEDVRVAILGGVAF